MASRAYQASSVKGKGAEKEEGLFNFMQLRPMSPEQLFDSLLTATERPSRRQRHPERSEARRLAAAVPLRLRQ